MCAVTVHRMYVFGLLGEQNNTSLLRVSFDRE